MIHACNPMRQPCLIEGIRDCDIEGQGHWDIIPFSLAGKLGMPVLWV